MTAQTADGAARRTRVRWLIILVLFVITTINYADRATFSIAGQSASKELGLDPVAMGYILSAFAWAYVLGQIPGGALLDRFGSKKIYTAALVLWSGFTLLQGFAGIFTGRVTRWEMPGGPGVRIDSHMSAGATVPPYYDSLIGKLIVHGATRADALARLRVALDEARVDGISTNLPLHRRIAADPVFAAGCVDIHYLEKVLLSRGAA